MVRTCNTGRGLPPFSASGFCWPRRVSIVFALQLASAHCLYLHFPTKRGAFVRLDHDSDDPTGGNLDPRDTQWHHSATERSSATSSEFSSLGFMEQKGASSSEASTAVMTGHRSRKRCVIRDRSRWEVGKAHFLACTTAD